MPHEVPAVEARVTPSVGAGFALWQHRLERLEAEMGSLAGTNQWPEWWTTEDTTLMNGLTLQLKAEGADVTNLSRYYDLASKEDKLTSTLRGRESLGRPLPAMISQFGVDLVARGFAAEAPDGSLHKAMLADIDKENESTQESLTPELSVLKEAYRLSTMTELLGIGGDEYSDKLRAVLLKRRAIHWIRYSDEAHDLDFKWHDMQEATRDWMSKAVEAATGMPAAEASDYVFSASRRNDNESKNIIDIIEKMDSFGLDRVRKLAEFSGIHGLEAYSTEQLERMEALANNPAEIAEKLANHDVIAVMINRFGDHNGILRDVAADFDDNGRTLFFEITSMDEIYRRMVTLRKAGIQPSTLVLAAHSGPGEFRVSDVREKAKAKHRRDTAAIAGHRLVAMVNEGGETNPREFGYSMHGMKGMARLVEEYMRPSRAIDDDEVDEGRKKIIFSACHAGTEVEMSDIDDNGEKYQIGMESVIGRLGKDLIASGVQTKVDIYGAPGGIQMHRNERGVHYSSRPIDPDSLKGRPHLAALRVRVEDGKFSQEEVHDIVLRKKS